MCNLQNYNQDFKLLELIAYKYCKIIPFILKRRKFALEFFTLFI